MFKWGLYLIVGLVIVAAMTSFSNEGKGVRRQPTEAITPKSPPPPDAKAVAIKTNRNLPRSEFRSLILGKSAEELVAAIGSPYRTQDTDLGRFWYYENIAPDPVTGKKSLMVQIVMVDGRAQSVNFD